MFHIFKTQNLSGGQLFLLIAIIKSYNQIIIEF